MPSRTTAHKTVTGFTLRTDQVVLLRRLSSSTRTPMTEMVRDALDHYFQKGPGRALIENPREFDYESTLLLLDEARSELVEVLEGLRAQARRKKKEEEQRERLAMKLRIEERRKKRALRAASTEQAAAPPRPIHEGGLDTAA